MAIFNSILRNTIWAYPHLRKYLGNASELQNLCRSDHHFFMISCVDNESLGSGCSFFHASSEANCSFWGLPGEECTALLNLSGRGRIETGFPPNNSRSFRFCLSTFSHHHFPLAALFFIISAACACVSPLAHEPSSLTKAGIITWPESLSRFVNTIRASSIALDSTLNTYFPRVQFTLHRIGVFVHYYLSDK